VILVDPHVEHVPIPPHEQVRHTKMSLGGRPIRVYTQATGTAKAVALALRRPP
jgi:hypothetical protein